MRLLHAANELQPGLKKVCLAIGVFDGVHLGHQQIIRQTIADARQLEGLGVVVTFDRHPNAVVAPDRVPPLIYCLSQKIRALEVLGADALLLIRFDEPFSKQSGETFVRALAHDLGSLSRICVGADFVFGHRRSGNVDLLRVLGAELHFAVHGMAAVALDGKPVSSTRIRECIQSGDLDGAGQMLGRAYSLAGKVVAGDGLGRKLGFPTANLDVSGLVLPPPGVYAAHAELAGKPYRAVLNLGWRPTLAQPVPQFRAEAHLLDFQGDLYGQEVELVLVDRLRPEQKFASLEELKAQINRDIRAASQLFDK